MYSKIEMRTFNSFKCWWRLRMPGISGVVVGRRIVLKGRLMLLVGMKFKLRLRRQRRLVWMKSETCRFSCCASWLKLCVYLTTALSILECNIIGKAKSDVILQNRSQMKIIRFPVQCEAVKIKSFEECKKDLHVYYVDLTHDVWPVYRDF